MRRFARADRTDWPLVEPLWRDVVSRGDAFAYRADTPPDEARASWFADRRSETWLATGADGSLAGSYVLRENHAGPADHVANAAFLVAPVARRRGVGRVLLAHCLTRARALGFEAMQFNAVVEHNVAAVGLWTSDGFRVVGRVPGGFRLDADRRSDLLVMYREL